jgi:aspartate/methionine/tyrosine aminotransferase
MRIKTFDIEKWYSKYEFSSKYNLSTSGISPSFFFDKNKEIINNIKIYEFPYSEGQGNKELRDLLSHIYNVKSENILITNGAIESLFLLQTVLSEKNINIICLKPTYNALFQIFESFGVNIINWEIKYENNFRPDFENLEFLIKKYKISYIIINFPNNPTGIDLNKDELNKLEEISFKYKLKIISDEVYKDLSNNINYYWNKNRIIISSLSKAYGLPGIRIGWIISESKLIKKLLNAKHYTTLCNNYLSEHIAIEVLKNREYYLNLSNKIRKENYNFLLKNSFFKFIPPDSGLTVFGKLDFDSEKFCEEFQKKESILLLPGNKYGKSYKNFFRLGFGIEKNKLIYCLSKLKEFIFKYKISIT